MTIMKGNAEIVIPLTEPRWRILRTRRANEPRRFKNLVTIFSYIEEKFPSVRNVSVKIMQGSTADTPMTKTPAGKSSGRKPAKKGVAKATKKATSQRG